MRSTRGLPYPEKIKGFPRIVQAPISSILSLFEKRSYMSSSFYRESPVPYLGTSADDGSSDPYTQQMSIIETSSHRSTYVSTLQDWDGCGGTTTVSRGEQYAAGPTSFPERVSDSFPAPPADTQFPPPGDDGITTPANFLASMERTDVAIPVYSLGSNQTNGCHTSNHEATFNKPWSAPYIQPSMHTWNDRLGHVHGPVLDIEIPQFYDDFDPNLSIPVMRPFVSQPSMSSDGKPDQTQYVPDQYNASNALCPPISLPHSRSSPLYGEHRRMRVPSPSTVRLTPPDPGPRSLSPRLQSHLHMIPRSLKDSREHPDISMSCHLRRRFRTCSSSEDGCFSTLLNGKCWTHHG
ncbi:hypothetical protein PILCRDRAFT_10650 [Piloderma croceum F 1598]|uniref:Uncharacterized protein n=1 Tax=Piloderma croceum (strain F 1598) TaxID=765440 RepID=A0A0C3AYA4_PILCF|nr:hypothetical protein PILCRDRAFT_10650 [Piloderma croceum F 1598]